MKNLAQVRVDHLLLTMQGGCRRICWTVNVAKVIWKDVVLAQSDDIVVVENNLYFPIAAINSEYFSQNTKTSFCPWKGTASYYDITVDNETNVAAAWYYPDPKEAASQIKDRVAFWNGVQVEK